jgi:hypothetical protein
MRRSISSALTFFYKVVCLTIWMGLGFYALTEMLIRLDALEAQKALPLFGVIWLIGLGLLWWTNLSLKKVEIEGEVLHVSNYLKTIEVRLNNIVLAKEIIGRGNLPRYRVKLELNIDTEFGKNIFFVPNFEFDLPKFLEMLETSRRHSSTRLG